jgi:hypothetical protein
MKDTPVSIEAMVLVLPLRAVQLNACVLHDSRSGNPKQSQQDLSEHALEE